MKQILPIFAMLVCFNISYGQNVGIGTNNPQTKLAIDGAVSYKVIPIVASNSITIPADISVVYIINNSAISLNSAMASSPKEGQMLTIYNEDAEVVNFAGEAIDAQSGAATFVYMNGSWRLIAKNNAGWNTKGNAGAIPSNTNPLINVKANNSFLGTLDANDLVFATNGFERMRITTAADGVLGKIGIGTSTPIGKLSIVEAENNITAPALIIDESNDGNALEINETGGGSALTISSQGWGFGLFSNLFGPTTTSRTVGHWLSDSRTFTAFPGEKIGLLLETGGQYSGNNIGLMVSASGGTTNTSAIFKENVGFGNFNEYDVPLTTLDIKVHDVTPTNATPGMLNIMSDDAGATAALNRGGSMSFSGLIPGASLFELRVFGSIEGRKENTLTYDERGYLTFKTNGNGSLAERMRIDGYGRVGIGTINPMARLELSYPYDIITESTIPGMLNVMTSTTGGAADIGGSISLGGYRNTALEYRVYGTIEGRKSLTSTGSSSGYLMFKTNNGGTLDERMRIFNDGVVRINSLAGSGVRVVSAGADGSLDAVTIGTLETDPTWSETANIVGTTGVITRAGRVMTASSFVVGTSITTATGPGTGNDNQYHNTVFASSQTAMTGISIYATGTHLDGDIKIFGVPATDLVTTTNSWYGLNAGATSAGSATNTVSTGADDQYHTAQCPDNRVATGIEIYASGALDGNMKLRCNLLTSGYSTTNNGIGVESLINAPFADANNINHMSTCPAGTFVKGIRIYASSRLDNQVQVFCTGIKKN